MTVLVIQEKKEEFVQHMVMVILCKHSKVKKLSPQ